MIWRSFRPVRHKEEFKKAGYGGVLIGEGTTFFSYQMLPTYKPVLRNRASIKRSVVSSSMGEN